MAKGTTKKKTESKFWNPAIDVAILFFTWVLVAVAVQGGVPVLTYTGGYVVGLLVMSYLCSKNKSN